jgi:hypothetical protein
MSNYREEDEVIYKCTAEACNYYEDGFEVVKVIFESETLAKQWCEVMEDGGYLATYEKKVFGR